MPHQLWSGVGSKVDVRHKLEINIHLCLCRDVDTIIHRASSNNYNVSCSVNVHRCSVKTIHTSMLTDVLNRDSLFLFLTAILRR